MQLSLLMLILVGMVLLEAYKISKDPQYLRYSEKCANALIYGQHPEGGWHYFIDFDPQGINKYYEEIKSRPTINNES